MGKSNNITAKELIISNISKDLNIPEDIVERVVSDQFKQVNKAFTVYDEIEVSGFGKFLQSQNKIKRRIKKCEDIIFRLDRRLKEASTQEEVISLTKAIDGITTKLSFYNSKLKPVNEDKRYNFGVEESSISSREVEGGNTEGEQRAVGDMPSLPTQFDK